MMIFRQLFDPVSSTYTYLLAARRGGEALLIDPVLDQYQTYLQVIDELDLRLVMAVDTHIHADHITALGKLREVTACVTVMGERSQAECVSRTVSEDELLNIDGVKMRALFTPGHTDESFSFVMADRVFTGDVL